MEINDAIQWLEENLTFEQLTAIYQIGRDETGCETWIAALMADYATDVKLGKTYYKKDNK